MKSLMSRKGDCWDNYPRRAFGSPEIGPFVRQEIRYMKADMDEVMGWMSLYNHRKIYSTLGYVSPMQLEKSWHAAQLK